MLSVTHQLLDTEMTLECIIVQIKLLIGIFVIFDKLLFKEVAYNDTPQVPMKNMSIIQLLCILFYITLYSQKKEEHMDGKGEKRQVHLHPGRETKQRLGSI